MLGARDNKSINLQTKHWAVWFGLLASALIFYPWSVSSNWTSNSDVHALFEFWSAFVALTAGLIIMIHYFANGSWLFLIISLGFVLQGGEDVVHAIFSFSRIWGEEQQDIIKFVPGTYVIGRFILGVCILFGWFLREKYTDEAQRIKASFLVLVSGIALSIFSTILIIQLPLPSFIVPARIISRPADLVVTLIYISAVVLYIKEFRNRKYHTRFVFSIICSLIYGIAAQIYMVHSQGLYDSQFDMAHIMKIISYVIPILGISFGTFSMYKNEAEHRKALALSVQKEKELAAAATAAAEAEQKKAAELAAAMLQLHGSQQQLMAANQQLTVKEQALREAQKGLEMKYRLIVDTAVEGIWVVGTDAMTTYVNARMTEMLGYCSEEIIGRPVTDFMFEEDASDHLQKIENRRLGQSEIYERRFHRKDGRTVWTTASAAPIFDEESNFCGSFAMFTDITEKKRAEEALRESEAFIKSILESVDEGFIVLDRSFNILSVNRAYLRLCNRTDQNVIGKHCYEISYHFDNPCYECGKECAPHITFMTGEPQTAIHKHAVAGGKTVVFETKAYPMKDETGNVVSVIEILVDVTEKIKLEEQLHQAQKMEAIGTLAGGVAHDFNNILTAIIGYSDLVKMKMEPDDPKRPQLDQVLASANRAAGLTQGLLAVSRKQIIEPKPVDLNNIVLNVEKLLRRLIGEDIEFITQLAAKELIAMADTGQIEQVLMNLATNARDAMQGGGTLALTTQELDLKEDSISAHGMQKPGRYALITVSDTGAGMNEQTREKIFEPFFTTKGVGQGTGLGLSIVYGIVKQHNGQINCYSEPGVGTTFKVYIPLVAVNVDEARSEAQTQPRGGTETILFAEDDQDIRSLIIPTLRNFGYCVIDAADGQEAIDKFVNHKMEIDLVVLDVVMPKRSGKEVYDAVKTARPEIKALFISGYTADIIHKKGIFEKGMHFISKPVGLVDLLTKIRQILDNK